ncbi:MAG: DUF1501 domain-containing protein [Gemmataceae bacterium]
MFTIWGNRHGFCDGVSRRDFIKVGAFGAGLTLADMLRLQALAGPNGTTGTSSRKSAIMIYLGGGPSHMDMYDPKPEAPVEFRGEFKAIQTNVPGVQICEHFPLQAKMWDKLACMRSLVTVNEHSDVMVMTGTSNRENMTLNNPSFGSVISKIRGDSGDTPPFVSLRGSTRGTEPGYLGVAHRPFTPSGPGLNNLRMANGVTANRLDDRRKLLDSFDTIRRDIDASGAMEGMDSFTTRAFDIVNAGKVRDALDRSKFTAEEKERYKGCENFLTARKLVEAGVGCVTLSIGGWDTHSNNFVTLARQLPVVDRGVANLIQDLHDRGMGDDVITVMWGEFGRTPKVNARAGRDHWPAAAGALVAGGGFKMGQAVGATNSRGERPIASPYAPANLLATMYYQMGIDPAMTFLDGSGRPRHLLDDRRMVTELL